LAQHKHHVQLLLTDLVMPDGMTGRELAVKLLGDQPSLKVIYTSGYSEEIRKGYSFVEGVNFLPKALLARQAGQPRAQNAWMTTSRSAKSASRTCRFWRAIMIPEVFHDSRENSCTRATAARARAVISAQRFS